VKGFDMVLEEIVYEFGKLNLSKNEFDIEYKPVIDYKKDQLREKGTK
jgi:hypothetical protein